ncbi:hypothetical protein AB1Y20_014332 [Prymnesium parvum]|uniref:Alpha-1,3-glucosyltransferase n=1 Tax=Prymnesium parvum TaxID=97485 RepID=A0AB34IDE3_PRYPA
MGTASAHLQLLAGSALKLLLLPAYHSTDFEVHRHWMALTSSLPLSHWYTDTTSEWTLDYPPFFAYFERCLALLAPLFDAEMLTLSPTPYASPPTVLYQRLTVIFADIALLVGASRLASGTSLRLTVLNAGLLLVDHVHFQYNGLLVGLLLLVLAKLRRGEGGGEVCAAAIFASLLQLKHLFLFAAPLVFVQLLRHHVMRAPRPALALRRLAGLGAVVVGVFGASLAPFAAVGQLPQLARRLFPFGRGLMHAYWAANAYALYATADKAMAAAGRATGAWSVAAGQAVGTAGLVLPDIRAPHCAFLVLLLQAPVLVGTWRRPRPEAIAPAAVYCGLAAFLCGYHVHEKAILPPLLVLSAISPPADPTARGVHARLLLLLSTAGHYALLPLLHQPAEYTLSRALLLAYFAAAWAALTPPSLRWHDRLYLAGFVPLELFVSFVHPLLLSPRLPFLPLLATSLYCSLGVHMSMLLAYRLWAHSSNSANRQED